MAVVSQKNDFVCIFLDFGIFFLRESEVIDADSDMLFAKLLLRLMQDLTILFFGHIQEDFVASHIHQFFHITDIIDVTACQNRDLAATAQTFDDPLVKPVFFL